MSCCHDSTASGQRVLSHDVFRNARKDFANVIAKKGWPRVLAMEPFGQEEIESLLVDATVDHLFIWDLWSAFKIPISVDSVLMDDP